MNIKEIQFGQYAFRFPESATVQELTLARDLVNIYIENWLKMLQDRQPEFCQHGIGTAFRCADCGGTALPVQTAGNDNG